jgi:hypothetical protein
VRFAGKGEQRHVSGPLDRLGHHALMLGACAGLSPTTDLPLVGDKASQNIRLLVGQRLGLVSAKLANPRTPAESAPG